jgi:hypothetical protein
MRPSSTPTCRRRSLTGNADDPEIDFGWAAGSAFIPSANGRFSPLGDEIHPWMLNGGSRPKAVVRGRDQRGFLLLCSAWLATAPDVELSGNFFETRQIVRDRVPRCHRSSVDMIVNTTAWIVVQRSEGDNREVAIHVKPRHARSAANAETLGKESR